MRFLQSFRFAGAKVRTFFEPTKYFRKYFRKMLSRQWIPALRLEFKLLIVTGYEHLAEFLVSDVADEFDTLDLLDFLVIAYGNGEEQFVVLATVEGAGGDVHIHLLGHDGGLVVDGDVLLIDAAADARLFADMHEFGGETVADVHHGGGTDACLAEFLDDVATGLGLELALQKVFLTAEVGLEMGEFLQSALVALLLGLLHLLVIHTLLALEQLESHIGGSEVATDTDEIGVLGSVTINDILFLGLSDTGDRDGQSCIGRGGVTADDIDVPLVAGQFEASIELLEILDREPLADGQRDGDLAGRAVHGEHVTDVHHRTLIAEVLQVDVGQIEVYAFHQQVGGDEHFLVGVGEHGAVVAYAVFRTLILDLYVFRETVDETKLTKFCYFHANL